MMLLSEHNVLVNEYICCVYVSSVSGQARHFTPDLFCSLLTSVLPITIAHVLPHPELIIAYCVSLRWLQFISPDSHQHLH